MLQLGAASRELRRALRPIEWVVLEDVALDARRDDAGRLVAPTSARQVAQHLSLTPGVVARALARLRREGLLTYVRQEGPAGRFGLSIYVLGPVPSLEVVEPSDARPHRLPPCPARPNMDRPRAADAHMVAAAAPRSVGADPPRSVKDYAAAALAGAIDDVRAEERARSTASPAAAKRGRRSVPKPIVAQLSILDPVDDSELAQEPGTKPMTATSSALHDDQPTMTTPVQRPDPTNSPYRTSHASPPSKPIPTDTCHLFEEARGPVVC